MHLQPRKDWASTLRECTDLATLRHLHARISSSGHHRRVFLGNLLIQTYARCGSIKEADTAFASITTPNVYSWTILVAAHIQTGDLDGAREIFEAMPRCDRDVVAWNSLIGAYARRGDCGEAIYLFREMDLDGVHPDSVTFLAVADACSRKQCLDLARFVHEIVVGDGRGCDSKVGSAMVNMFGKCGGIEEARRCFDLIQEHNVVAWTAMLTAYAQNGHLLQALEIFATMPEKNVVSWNAIVSASSQQGEHLQAVVFFYEMIQEGIRPSSITMVSVLDAAASMTDLATGSRAHAVAIDAGLVGDTSVANALMHLYGECGRPETAEAIFAGMEELRDTMSWNVIIGARAKVDPTKALATFWRMDLEGWPRPSVVTYVAAIHACAMCASVAQGKLLHDRVVDLRLLTISVVLATAVVTMYGRCGRTAAARAAFDGIPAADVDGVAWSAMLAAYAQNGQGREALAVLARMDVLGIKPSAVTYISAVEACSSVECGEMVEIVHAGVLEGGFESNPAVASALVHAYGRCAALPAAIHAFSAGPQHDVALWNSLITAFAGNETAGSSGVLVFREMVAEGVAANEITFMSVMCCCRHAGLVEDVWSCFVEMSGDHGVVPGVDHYACLVDVLGRAGKVAEAEELMSTMPFEPDSAAWTSFLDACRGSSDVKCRDMSSRAAAANALVGDPHSSGPYVLLSNIHKEILRV